MSQTEILRVMALPYSTARMRLPAAQRALGTQQAPKSSQTTYLGTWIDKRGRVLRDSQISQTAAEAPLCTRPTHMQLQIGI